MEDEEPIQFTDEEVAFLRHARFGELPARVLPEDRVELTETDGRRDIPEHLGDPHEWTNHRVGGGY
jgi:hypothetical protein